jgi:hypothetical protein
MRQWLPDSKDLAAQRWSPRSCRGAGRLAPAGAVALLAAALAACLPGSAVAQAPGSGRPPSVQAPPAAPAAPQAAAADPQALLKEIAQLRKELEEIRKAYDERLVALEAQAAAAAAAATPPPRPEPAPTAAPAASSKVFNPDVAVIGNLLGTAGTNAVSPSPSIQLKEAEVSFQAVVDPYARADFFVSFGQDEASLEEGYITFPTVPGGLLVRAGQMRTAFGKLNPLHPHVLPWPDRPIVMRNLVGGEDGVADAGVSVARLIPNPWFFLEATGQVYRGDQGNLFHASEASDLNYLARLRAYQDVSESTNVDLGASFSMGHNDAGVTEGVDTGRFTTRLYGVDATVRYKPLRRSIYRSFVGRTELVWSRRQQFDGVQPAFGYYVSGDYQFARRWYAGLRYDRSDRADQASVYDTGEAVVLTFWPSEFSQLRAMYRRTRYAQSETANELLLQVQFAIGAHGAHPF